MKALIIPFFAAMLATGSEKCSNKKPAGCYKARLEIEGICSNYTIKILEGNIDTSMVSATWTDENTGKQYSNVFGLDSPCSFPKDLKEGDEFYFTINNKSDKDCTVCMAYYPTPPKKLSITVSKSPCR